MESPQGDSSCSSRSIKPSNEDELIKEILGSDGYNNNIFSVKPLLNIINVIFSGLVDSSGFIKVIFLLKKILKNKTNIWKSN